MRQSRIELAENRIALPERIESSIGYNAWTALSWALQNQWVQDYKWLRSQNGRDVGTQLTIEHIIGYLPGLLRCYRPDSLVGRGAQYMFGERCGDADPKTFRDLMIEGYLLGTDFVSPLWVMKQGGKWKPQDLEQTGVVQDEHGANQLEGELKRFWAYKSGMQPADVKVGAGILGTFCDESGLHADVYKAFGKKLNLF